jgi:hypothetical protein
MRFLVLALGALLMTACVTPDEMRNRQAASDRMECKGYGFTPGTELYAQCRMNLTQNREARQSFDHAAAMQGLNALGMQLQQQEAQRRAAFEASIPRMTQTNCRRLFNGDVSCTTW